jgi:uncharacterized protein (DUF169 family)
MITLNIKVSDLTKARFRLEDGSDAFCGWMGKARDGKDIYVGEENISCLLAKYKLGYERPADLEETLVSWGDASSKKEAIFYLDNTVTIQGRKVFHLSRKMENPDLVVCFGDPDEIMYLIRDYSSRTGKRVQSRVSGIGAMCGELCAFPYVTGQPCLSVGCGGSRRRVFGKNEVAVSFPGSLAKKMRRQLGF